jgi:hypothetical protein
MQMAKRLLLVALALMAALLLVRFAQSRGSALAPELRPEVPSSGLMLGRLYGRTTPLPVPLYGPGTVYGSLSEPTLAGTAAASILEGTYAPPDAVARFYLDRLFPAKPAYYDDHESSDGRTIHLRFEGDSGRLSVFIMTHPAGLRRDVSPWRDGANVREAVGGDPRETMVLVSVIDRPRGKQGTGTQR